MEPLAAIRRMRQARHPAGLSEPVRPPALPRDASPPVPAVDLPPGPAPPVALDPASVVPCVARRGFARRALPVPPVWEPPCPAEPAVKYRRTLGGVVDRIRQRLAAEQAAISEAAPHANSVASSSTDNFRADNGGGNASVKNSVGNGVTSAQDSEPYNNREASASSGIVYRSLKRPPAFSPGISVANRKWKRT